MFKKFRTVKLCVFSRHNIIIVRISFEIYRFICSIVLTVYFDFAMDISFIFKTIKNNSEVISTSELFVYYFVNAFISAAIVSTGTSVEPL